jgi:hypothetical protein
MSALARMIEAGRRPALAVLLFVTALLTFPASRVEVERSNESMNASSDARVEV